MAADSLFPGSPSVASSVSWQVALLSRSSTAVSVHSGTANLDVVGLMLMPAAHRGCRGLPPASGLATFACGSDWCRRHSLLAEFCDGFGLAESRGPSSSSDEVRARCRPLIHTPRVGLGVISTGGVLCALLVLVVSFHFLEYASVIIFSRSRGLCSQVCSIRCLTCQRGGSRCFRDCRRQCQFIPGRLTSAR